MKHIPLATLGLSLLAQTLCAQPITTAALTDFFTTHAAAATGGHMGAFTFDHTHMTVLEEQADVFQVSVPELQEMLISADSKRGQDIEITAVQAFPDRATTGQTPERGWALVPLKTTVRSTLSRTSSEFCTLFSLFEDKGQLFILSARDGEISAGLPRAFPDLAVVPITTQPDCAAPQS